MSDRPTVMTRKGGKSPSETLMPLTRGYIAPSRRRVLATDDEEAGLRAHCINALSSSEWKTTREVVWDINGPRERTFASSNILLALKKLKRDGIVERGQDSRPRSNKSTAFGGVEFAETWRLSREA